jgi:hypothetical protein
MNLHACKPIMAYTEDRSTWFEGQGLWQHVPESDWKDWAWQLKNRLTKLEDLERYMTLTADERAGVLFAGHKLAMAITPYFFNLIDRNDPNCPLRLQMIPRAGEGQLHAEEMLDSLGEDEHSPVPGFGAPLPGSRAVFGDRPLCFVLPLLHAQPAGFQRAGLQFPPRIRAGVALHRVASGDPGRAPFRRRSAAALRPQARPPPRPPACDQASWSLSASVRASRFFYRNASRRSFAKS